MRVLQASLGNSPHNEIYFLPIITPITQYVCLIYADSPQKNFDFGLRHESIRLSIEKRLDLPEQEIMPLDVTIITHSNSTGLH